uniref:Uncharacterized protein n=1 Tax=Oryza sativa subsp. japonica TaxID=39947 RepID=Q2QWF1_ORYSJ|nr:hypothetical protein LOC_Os12g09560 [Oryza sativa Japonica Group]
MLSSLLPFFLLRPSLLSLFLFLSSFSSPSAGGGWRQLERWWWALVTTAGGSNVGGLERRRRVGAAIDLNVLLRLGSSASVIARMDNSAPRSSYCSVASSRVKPRRSNTATGASWGAIIHSCNSGCRRAETKQQHVKIHVATIEMTTAICILRFLLLSLNCEGKNYKSNNIYRENIDFLLRTLPLKVSASDTLFAKVITNSTKEQVYTQCRGDTDISTCGTRATIWCNLRYEGYPFFTGPPMLDQLIYQATVKPKGTNHKNHTTILIVAIVVPSVVVIIVVLAPLFLLRKKHVLKKRTKLSSVELSGSKNIEGFVDSRGEKDAELTESKEIEGFGDSGDENDAELTRSKQIGDFGDSGGEKDADPTRSKERRS